MGLPEEYKMHMTKGKKEEEEVKEEEAADAKQEPAADVMQDPAADAAANAQAPAVAEQAEAGAAPEAAAEQQAAAAPPKPAPAPKSFLSDPSTLEQLRGVAMGCCVALMRREDAATLGFAAEGVGAIAIACWRGRANLNILVSKQEAAQLRERIAEAKDKAAGKAATAPKAEPVAA